MESAAGPESSACDQERVIREIRNIKKAAWARGDLNLVMRAIDREIKILGLDERSRWEEHLRQQEVKLVHLMDRFMSFTFDYIEDPEDLKAIHRRFEPMFGPRPPKSRDLEARPEEDESVLATSERVFKLTESTKTRDGSLVWEGHPRREPQR